MFFNPQSFLFLARLQLAKLGQIMFAAVAFNASVVPPSLPVGVFPHTSNAGSSTGGPRLRTGPQNLDAN